MLGALTPNLHELAYAAAPAFPPGAAFLFGIP